MKVINLFGGPGVGKSTIASGLFSLMKKQRMNVELITEYAKDMTWEGRHNILEDQIYITAKQNRKLLRLKSHDVDWAISDSPLLLGALYASKDYYYHYKPLLKEIFDSYDNINYFIDRKVKYDPTGRNQTEEEAKSLDFTLMSYLKACGVKFTCVTDEHEILKDILNG